MMITDKITQYGMERKLRRAYGQDAQIVRGPNGSLFIPSDAPDVPKWKIDGATDFDKFIKRMGMTAIDESGQEIGKYTMATRGTVDAGKNVTMITPIYKDKFGRRWTVIQEEARPIDIARNGKNSRVLAFPAGIIGDETAFQTESATESAVRELTEETGMKADKIKNLSPTIKKDGKVVSVPIMTSPGLTDESTYFFEARIKDIKPSTKAVTDGGVTRGWHFVPVKRLPKWLESLSKLGKIPSGQTMSAIALLLTKGKCKI